MKKKLHGVFAVPVTPYDEQGNINDEAVRDLARFCIQRRINGLFVAGSTGDMTLLDDRERADLVAITRDATGDAPVVFAGVNNNSIRSILKCIHMVRESGADFGILTPPPALKFSQMELVSFFQTIADKSELPLLLYHHVRASSPLECDTVVKLADHPQIVGLKETGTDHSRFLALLDATQGKNFTVLQGCERFVPESLAAGVSGTITALAAVWPEQAIDIWNAWQSGNENEIKKQNERQQKLCHVFDLFPTDISSSWFRYGLKKMLVRRGVLTRACCRMTGFQPEPFYEERLEQFLNEIGFPSS